MLVSPLSQFIFLDLMAFSWFRSTQVSTTAPTSQQQTSGIMSSPTPSEEELLQEDDEDRDFEAEAEERRQKELMKKEEEAKAEQAKRDKEKAEQQQQQQTELQQQQQQPPLDENQDQEAAEKEKEAREKAAKEAREQAEKAQEAAASENRLKTLAAAAADEEASKVLSTSVAYSLGHHDPVTHTLDNDENRDFVSALHHVVYGSDFPRMTLYEKGLLHEFKKEFVSGTYSTPAAPDNCVISGTSETSNGSDRIDVEKFDHFHGATSDVLKEFLTYTCISSDAERLLFLMLAAVEFDIQKNPSNKKPSSDRDMKRPFPLPPLDLFPTSLLQHLVALRWDDLSESEGKCLVLSLQLCMYKLHEAAKIIIETNEKLLYFPYVDRTYFGGDPPMFFNIIEPKKIPFDQDPCFLVGKIGDIVAARRRLRVLPSPGNGGKASADKDNIPATSETDDDSDDDSVDMSSPPRLLRNSPTQEFQAQMHAFMKLYGTLVTPVTTHKAGTSLT